MSVNNGKTVDVIMPFHRIDKYLHEALNCLEQTVDVRLRIILVDDRPVSQEKFKINSKFESLVITTNGVGYAKAVLAGISEVDSDYVAFLDSDDLCAPERFRFQIDSLDEKESDLSICGISKITENGKNKKLNLPMLQINNHFSLPLLIGSYGANSSWVIKSDLIRNGFLLNGVDSLDWATALAKFDKIKISFLKSNLYFYRAHSKQMTLNKNYQNKLESEIYPLWKIVNAKYKLPELTIDQFGACCYRYSNSKWTKQNSIWATAYLELISEISSKEVKNFEWVIGARLVQNILSLKLKYISKLELKCISQFFYKSAQQIIGIN